MSLRPLPSGVYQHWKGPLYLVLGYASDSNADTIGDHTKQAIIGQELEDRVEPFGERIVVMYISISGTMRDDGLPVGLHTHVRTASDFHAEVHLGNTGDFAYLKDGTVCEDGCKYLRLNQHGTNNHLTVPRFKFLGPRLTMEMMSE